MQIPLLDLKAQYRSIREEIRARIDEVCDAQYFILGPTVSAFEEHVAAFCGLSHGGACGVSSGSDALIVSLMVEGIGAGDEVITSAYTFFATAGAIVRVGATPVFVDIDPETFNLVPDQVAAAVTERTRAIMPVHLYGQVADMDPILEIADKRGLVVVEDACQAIGATYKGRKACTLGDFGCLSFFPSKNLGGFGDGGMVLTKTPERLARLVSFRNHGMNPKYYHAEVGGNFRLDALQAAVLDVKLRYLNQWAEARRRNAAEYRELFAACATADQAVTPALAPYTTEHVFNQYVVRLPAAKRDRVWEGLKERGVGCEVYYPVPLHLQKCFASLGYREGQLPESERAARETLALPIFPESTTEQREYVVGSIADLLQD
jgi:dTDP-4-amino-4,6-dideoxygalactose transaminase